MSNRSTLEIEEISVGDRIKTIQESASQIHVGRDWRVAYLSGFGVDDPYEEIHVTLLRPLEWLYRHGVTTVSSGDLYK